MVNNLYYTAVIMMFDEVLACVEQNARRRAVRAALRESGVRGRLNDSQLDCLWGDYTGGITAGMKLGFDFWKEFEEKVPGLIDAENDITLFEDAERLAEALPPYRAYIFNSPKGVHRLLLEKAGMPQEPSEEVFIGFTHCSGGSEYGYKRTLSFLIQEAVHQFGIKNQWIGFIGGIDPEKIEFTCAKGNHIDYIGVDYSHKAGRKTKYILGDLIVTSIDALLNRIAFFDAREWKHEEPKYRNRFYSQE